MQLLFWHFLIPPVLSKLQCFRQEMWQTHVAWPSYNWTYNVVQSLYSLEKWIRLLKHTGCFTMNDTRVSAYLSENESSSDINMCLTICIVPVNYIGAAFSSRLIRPCVILVGIQPNSSRWNLNNIKIKSENYRVE